MLNEMTNSAAAALPFGPSGTASWLIGSLLSLREQLTKQKATYPPSHPSHLRNIFWRLQMDQQQTSANTVQPAAPANSGGDSQAQKEPIGRFPSPSSISKTAAKQLLFWPAAFLSLWSNQCERNREMVSPNTRIRLRDQVNIILAPNEIQHGSGSRLFLYSLARQFRDDTKEDVFVHYSSLKPTMINLMHSKKRLNLLDKEKVQFDVIKSELLVVKSSEFAS